MARESSARARLDVLSIAWGAEQFVMANKGRFPVSIDDLVQPDAYGSAYLKTRRTPVDPWGRSYVYPAPAAGESEPRVMTLGRDGRIGGTGLDADVEWPGLIEGR